MSYPGGKGGAGVYQTIINQQPAHETYIEPFLGGGSVMLAKRPASTTIGVDVERSVIAGWGDGTKYAGSGVELICGCGISYLQNWRGGIRTLIYCDPPYVLSTRSHKKIYANEMTDGEHGALLDALLVLPCLVQISGYFSDLYANALKSWRMVRFMAMTRGGLREECLWMNYPEPHALHDYSFLGSDYRERERIKRKAHRWAARVNALPALERCAILSEVLQHR
jgi:hypothetical protein